MAEEQPMMTITLRVGGETRTKSVPVNGTVKMLFDAGFFDDLNREGLIVNGGPVGDDDVLAEGDEVCQMPKSGKQG